VFVTQCAVPLLKFESAVHVFPQLSGYKGPPAFTRHTEETTTVLVNVAVAVGVNVGVAAAAQIQANIEIQSRIKTLLKRKTRHPVVFFMITPQNGLLDIHK
jgi:hypothetical protein